MIQGIEGNGVSGEIEGLARSVIGAAIEVHRALGPGFLESVYEEALAIELDHRRIPYLRQYPVFISYRDQPVGEGRVDMLIAGRLIVELKATEMLTSLHQAQLLSYLKATGHPLGLLINFNVPILRDGIKRIIYTPKTGTSSS